jgi:glyoxylase-like metal-dependent hydrolase (beta-lactamase superfamily II)
MRVRDMEWTKPETPYVRQLPLGPMKNFVYLVGAAGRDEAFVIDPAWDVPAILSTLEADGRKLTGIFLTHHHHDHINGVPDLLKVRDVPVYVQQAEVEFAEALKPFAGAIRSVGKGECVMVAGVDVECLHTPGHTPGAQCLHCRAGLFTGDTLFVNACGRCDFAGSDPLAMHDSLFNVLAKLHGSTKMYPGHDYGDVKVSSLERERKWNPYFQLRDPAKFVKHRMTPR